VAGRGDADLEALLRDAAARLPRLTIELEWITPERKRELLNAADLMVLPYTAFSSQSGVLHDAFGSHLPAVVTDVGALRASVTDAGAGWVVTPGDPTALAQALVGAVRDRGVWAGASAGARQVAIDQGPERTGATLRAVYAAAQEQARAQRNSAR